MFDECRSSLRPGQRQDGAGNREDDLPAARFSGDAGRAGRAEYGTGAGDSDPRLAPGARCPDDGLRDVAAARTLRRSRRRGANRAPERGRDGCEHPGEDPAHRTRCAGVARTPLCEPVAQTGRGAGAIRRDVQRRRGGDGRWGLRPRGGRRVVHDHYFLGRNSHLRVDSVVGSIRVGRRGSRDPIDGCVRGFQPGRPAVASRAAKIDGPGSGPREVPLHADSLHAGGGSSVQGNAPRFYR